MGIFKVSNKNTNSDSSNVKMTKHSPGKHMLHMVLCCGLPMVILSLLPYIARISPAVSNILGYAAPFICPVMMGLMIFMMFRGNRNSCCEDTKNTRQLEASGQIPGEE